MWDFSIIVYYASTEGLKSLVYIEHTSVSNEIFVEMKGGV